MEFQRIPQSNTSFSDYVKRTHDLVPANMDMQTEPFSPKVPTPKPIVSKMVVKPIVGIVKSAVTTTSNKTTTHSGRVIKPPTKRNL